MDERRGTLAEALATAEEALGRDNHALEALRGWRTERVPAWLTRALDVAVAGTGLVALAPLFTLVALAVRATDGGPALYWQERVGRRGKRFWFPKFRTMVSGADAIKDSLLAQNQHGDSVTFKMKHDPRITWVGRWLRRFSIDELPQLWNVVKGEMTLVGPRPPVPREVARYTVADRRRLEAVPGLTCTWQVGGRAEIPFERQVEMDWDYIVGRDVGVDLELLARTFPAVLGGKGAY